MVFFELFKHEIVHFLLTILAAAVTYILVRKNSTLSNRRIRGAGKKLARKLLPVIGLGAFIGEFLLDADHLFDYFVAFGFDFQAHQFFRGDMFDKLQKVFVPLHSWELLPVLAIFIYLTKNKTLKYFFISLTLGFLFHMVYDTSYNHITIGYSLLYRILHGFDINSVVLPH